MAHLWIKGTDGWGARKLSGAALDLAEVSCNPARAGTAMRPGSARLIRADAGGAKTWALVAPIGSCVRVNSHALPAGLCVLADRDEIRIGAETSYFTTETLAAVEKFPGADRPVFCGRCRQPIVAGALAVCCPGCGIWYHQDADLPCFTYTEKCAFCGHATALDAGFAWVPEES